MNFEPRRLSTRAMLTRLQIRMWAAQKYDKDTSKEIADIHGATGDVGRFHKLLLPPEASVELRSARKALRWYHDKHTLPWTLDGVGLLPATNYFPYMAEHKRLAIMFDAAKEAFLGKYAAARESAKRTMGDLYRDDDYPSQDDLASRIACEVSVWPMPDAADFRVDLGDAEAARIRAEIEQSVNDACAAAVRSLWQRVHDTVSAMHDRLTKFSKDADGKVHYPFRDSLVGNMRELVELLPRLNFNQDPDLNDMTVLLSKKLCAVEPDALRTDDALRATQAAECARVLNLMSGYVGTPALAAE